MGAGKGHDPDPGGGEFPIVFLILIYEVKLFLFYIFSK